MIFAGKLGVASHIQRITTFAKVNFWFFERQRRIRRQYWTSCLKYHKGSIFSEKVIDKSLSHNEIWRKRFCIRIFLDTPVCFGNTFNAHTSWKFMCVIIWKSWIVYHFKFRSVNFGNDETYKFFDKQQFHWIENDIIWYEILKNMLWIEFWLWIMILCEMELFEQLFFQNSLNDWRESR